MNQIGQKTETVDIRAHKRECLTWIKLGPETNGACSILEWASLDTVYIEIEREKNRERDSIVKSHS